MAKRQHDVMMMILRDDGSLMLCEEGIGAEMPGIDSRRCNEVMIGMTVSIIYVAIITEQSTQHRRSRSKCKKRRKCLFSTHVSVPMCVAKDRYHTPTHPLHFGQKELIH